MRRKDDDNKRNRSTIDPPKPKLDQPMSTTAVIAKSNPNLRKSIGEYSESTEEIKSGSPDSKKKKSDKPKLNPFGEDYRELKGKDLEDYLKKEKEERAMKEAESKNARRYIK